MKTKDILDKCETGFYRIKYVHGQTRYTLERWADEQRGWLIGVPIHPKAAKAAAKQLIEVRGQYLTTWAR
jgi:hypothetical protein